MGRAATETTLGIYICNSVGRVRADSHWCDRFGFTSIRIPMAQQFCVTSYELPAGPARNCLLRVNVCVVLAFSAGKGHDA